MDDASQRSKDTKSKNPQHSLDAQTSTTTTTNPRQNEQPQQQPINQQQHHQDGDDSLVLDELDAIPAEFLADLFPTEVNPSSFSSFDPIPLRDVHNNAGADADDEYSDDNVEAD